MLVYSAIQIEQIHDAIKASTTGTSQLAFDPWPSNLGSLSWLIYQE